MQRAVGKTALVTGSTDGVGRVVAHRLGAAGARVLVHGRDPDRGESVVKEIRGEGGTAEFLSADFRSLAEVRRLADTVQAQDTRLDILVNNAGTTTVTREACTAGHELCFAVNYLAGFLLTRLLLPLLANSAPARIVNVASAGQQALDFENIMLTRDFSGLRAYRQSKLAQILFTMDLAREIAGSEVSVNALHPATYMNTTMVRRAGVKPTSSVSTGADAILNLALSPDLEGRSGLYFEGLREARAAPQAYHEEARRKLRNLSLGLTAPYLRRAP
jgi:NAD(P)-dependent dehydrogenase (short-subunit alcohol dehydrogenase family)